jgi:hypothetical protein
VFLSLCRISGGSERRAKFWAAVLNRREKFGERNTASSRAGFDSGGSAISDLCTYLPGLITDSVDLAELTVDVFRVARIKGERLGMRLSALQVALGALALGIVVSTPSANASTYTFTLTGTDNFTFQLPSNPTPDGFISGDYFFIANPPSLFANFITFYALGAGGGMSAGDGQTDIESSTLLFDLSGLPLYTGDESSPVFVLGTYILTNIDTNKDPYTDTLTISATPLPAALPLFASGAAGLGLLGWKRRRKKAATITA